MPGSSGCPGKFSNIYMDVLEAIFNNYFSAWGLVDGVDMLEGPL
jgi:hypothetical protein